jgi:L-threonylcarbamoyladenylate synthase
MEILSSSDKDIERAAAALAAGFLVAFPTETVYGLGADAFNVAALVRVFEVKNRPFFDPLIVHIGSTASLYRIADVELLSNTAKERLSVLSEKLWPGPLTLVVPKRKELPNLATAGLPTAALRFPSHPAAQKLIRLSTGAVAAPSANLFGCLSATRAEHVKVQLSGKVDYIIDGGKTTVGLESTVLDLSREPPVILRRGGTSRESIEALIGKVELSLDSGTPSSPGQLKGHYAPGTPLELSGRGELESVPGAPNEGRLYFSSPKSTDSVARERTRILSEKGDLTEAASNLFDMLHELDSLGLALIRAEEAPCCGLGAAINDRLRRAEHGSRLKS